MTFEEFQKSKEYREKFAQDLDEFGPCFIYGDVGCKTYWIIINDGTYSWKEKYYTLISTDEYVSDELEDLERRLYEAFFLGCEMNASISLRATELVKKWVGILGGGLHPDTRADDYNPPLSYALQIEYEEDMNELFCSCGDPYGLIVEEMERTVFKK